MDVTRTPLHGMTPYLSHRESLRAPTESARFGRAAAAIANGPPRAAPVDTVDGGGTTGGGTSAPEIAGTPDGGDVVLASGVRIRRMRIGSARVGDAELQQAIRGVQLLPAAHQMLIARLGIPIELIPVVQLERLPGLTDPVVGATRVVGPDGGAKPERIRIAAYQAQLKSSVTEATQHEIGHAIAVTARQDMSEATAEQYARSY